MNQRQSSLQAPLQAPTQTTQTTQTPTASQTPQTTQTLSSLQTPTAPQFVIQANQPTSGWDKAMDYSTSCGKFVGLSGGVVCAILIIILCGVGIFLYRKKVTTVYNKVSATIVSANCTQYVSGGKNNSTIKYNCVLKVRYNIGGVDYENTLTSTDNFHNSGEIRDIYYNVSNPNDIQYSYITDKSMGKIFIAAGSCFIILLAIHIVLTLKSEWYNRLQCLSAASNIVASPFRN